MKPLHFAARRLAERFTGEGLDKIEDVPAGDVAAGELREAALNWIEHHTEKRLATRALLETT
jgi:hypothetical protein